MRVRALAPMVLAGFAFGPACTATWAADNETRVETVAGYEISRVNDPKDAHPCRMVRGYADPADNNAANALAFGELDGLLLVSLVYERWKWPAGKTVTSRFSVDKTLIDAQAPWLGNATYLAIRVPISHLPTFNTGRKIVLGFKDGTADFDLTGFEPAFEATRRCNRDAVAARTAAVSPAKPAPQTPAGSASVAAVPPQATAPAQPAPQPVVKAAPAVAAIATPVGPLPGEDHAVAYLFALYDRWAFDVCEMRTTAKQRAALEAKAAALKPEMAAIDADLLKEVPTDPSRCPPAPVIEKQLALLIDNTPEDFVAKMDKRTMEEFRGIVRPTLQRLKPPVPSAAATANPLPSELRIGAYLLGLTLQDALQRCDFATTAKQRAGLDAKVEALRPEMAEVESTVRTAIEKRGCPGPNDLAGAQKEVGSAINGFIAMTPEEFAASIDAKRRGTVTRDAKKIVATVRPSTPEPSPAQFATFLWGLVMQDKIAQCDIATTAKQRAGLDARVASLKQELGAYEGVLRDQVKGKTEGCPSQDKAAEFLALLPVFIDARPEVFAAEMDKQTAARTTRAATPAAKPASCGQTAFPQTRADLVAALKDRLRPFGVEDVVERPRSVANHRRYDLKGADVTIDMDGADGRITAFSVNQNGETSKREAEVALAAASYIVATFTRGPVDKVEGEMTARLGKIPVSPGHSEKFDTSTVFYAKQDAGFVSMLVDNADAGDCKP